MKPRDMLRVSIAAALFVAALAAWAFSDVARGEAGPEDLVLSLPALVSSVCIAAIMVARLRRSGSMPTEVSPLPGAVGAESLWRYAKGSAWGVSLLIVLSVGMWGVRSGSVWRPALVGRMAILITWISMAIFLRPK